MAERNLTQRQRTTLNNMHVLRRKAILRRMRNGESFSAADKATQDVFDTVGWHEVLSRLRRARGIVGWIAAVIAKGGAAYREPEVAEVFRRLIAQIRKDAVSLLAGATKKPSQRKEGFTQVRKSKSPHIPRPSKALGQLRAAMKFVAKCRRDAPLIEKNGGTPLTENERAKINIEINEILTRLRRFDKLLHR